MSQVATTGPLHPKTNDYPLLNFDTVPTVSYALDNWFLSQGSRPLSNRGGMLTKINSFRFAIEIASQIE